MQEERSAQDLKMVQPQQTLRRNGRRHALVVSGLQAVGCCFVWCAVSDASPSQGQPSSTSLHRHAQASTGRGGGPPFPPSSPPQFRSGAASVSGARTMSGRQGRVFSAGG